MSVLAMFRPGMRTYLVPLVAGVTLAASAFLPWIHIGDVTLIGVPDMTALWIVALGISAALLATLSMITRRNSRHPLLLVGLIALGLMFLSWRLMPRVVANRALTRSQALAIVEDTPVAEAPAAVVGVGIYLGMIAALTIVAFGLTIVVKRVSSPYVFESADDDV